MGSTEGGSRIPASCHVQDAQGRREIALESSVDFATALDLVGWKAIHRLPHSSSRQRLLYFTIKGLRLSGWDRLHERRGCPHCPHVGASGGSVYHIVWECPAAQLLWSRLRSIFTALGLWRATDTTTRTEFLTAVFSLRLPSVPPKVWELPSLRKCLPEDDDTGAGPFPVLQAVWQQLTLETFLVISAWRHSLADPTRAWDERQATAVHANSCHRVLDTLLVRIQHQQDPPEFASGLLAKFHGLLDEAHEPHDCQLPVRSPARVIFFAGTTRNNPGPGGAGAVLVDLATEGTTSTILWSVEVSPPDPAITHNQAAYHGLLAGLQAAVDNKWHDLTVIGDNALLLQQLRAYRPPRNASLRPLYHKARRLADQVGVQRWHHQVTAHNAMAKALATHATDAHTTSLVRHPTGRDCHADLPQLLASDLHPWLASQVDPRLHLHHHQDAQGATAERNGLALRIARSVCGLGTPQRRITIARFRDFCDYVDRTNVWRHLFVAGLTPLPSMVVTIALSAIPLQDPALGVWKNTGAFALQTGVDFFGMFGFAVMFRSSNHIPQKFYSNADVMTVCTLTAVLMSMFYAVIGYIWRFPVPFLVFIAAGPIIATFAFTHLLLLRLKHQVSFDLRTPLKKFLPFVIGQTSQVVLYVALSAVLTTTTEKGILVATGAVAAAKYSFRRLLRDVTSHLREDSNQLAAVAVEICASLYLSLILKRSPSYYATVGLLSVDVVHMAFVILAYMDKKCAVPRRDMIQATRGILALSSSTLDDSRLISHD